MSLAVFVVLVFVAASSGAVFKPGDWYESLAKPSWRPPNWAFPVVWSILYLLMAVAAWRVWESAPAEALPAAMAAWGVQLALNAGWSAIFFGMKRMRLALIELMALWVAVAVTIALFAPIDGLAAVMLAPYLAWVTTAGVLNWSMMRLNPDDAR